MWEECVMLHVRDQSVLVSALAHFDERRAGLHDLEIVGIRFRADSGRRLLRNDDAAPAAPTTHVNVVLDEL
jgi:hypothetical protein